MIKEALEILLANPNIKAFLTTIREAEGTNTPNGYRYLFGSRPGHELLMIDYTDHPQKYFSYKNQKGVVIQTSASGAYQIIFKTWEVLKKRLDLTDFRPNSQDLCAVELLREIGAIPLIEQGKFKEVINKARKIWASLPGSGVDQPERSFLEVTTWYQKAGGSIA